MRRMLAAGGAVAAVFVIQASPALACGGLVAPDGDVRLDKATTFVAWHAGIEHYVTSFAYSGSVADLGWIVPLPAVPTKIEPAGKWTLQRLEREFNPPRLEFATDALVPAAAGAGSIVVEQVQVEALDITVLKGSGQAVVDWCVHNGFTLPTETKDHLLQYAKGSPVFMAAKYNTSVAQQRGLASGDGVPLLMTMQTPQLWVPLEVLANDNAPVNADLFLLTDSPVSTVQQFAFPFFAGSNVDGAPGFTLVAQKPLDGLLQRDLSSDRNMGWVPSAGSLAYLRLNADSSQVTYDLRVGGDSVIQLASYGTSPAVVSPPVPSYPTVLVAGGSVGVVLLAITAAGFAVRRVRRRSLTRPGRAAGSR
jgi:hypothetical protein